MGFPDSKGFEVYRRESGAFEDVHCVDLSQRSVLANAAVEPGSSLDGVTFKYPGEMQFAAMVPA